MEGVTFGRTWPTEADDERMSMHRIYFDTNTGPDDGRYGLWVAGSLKDIAPIIGEIHDGLHVIIYMTGELEMEAVLKFDRNWNGWTAKPVEGTEIYYRNNSIYN